MPLVNTNRFIKKNAHCKYYSSEWENIYVLETGLVDFKIRFLFIQGKRNIRRIGLMEGLNEKILHIHSAG